MSVSVETSLPATTATTATTSTSPTVKSPLSPSALPEFALLPAPLAADSTPVGQLISHTGTLDPTALSDRDYDDIGTRWYKDVVTFRTATDLFTSSLGATLFVNKPAEGEEIGTIEAEEMRVRMLKNPDDALQKVLHGNGGNGTLMWLGLERGEIGFVTAVREVSNASYKRAGLVEAGNGLWEVVREVEAREKGDGMRRDSGLEVQTGSKRDVVGVVVRKVIHGGEDGVVRLGEEMGVEFWL
ncbi:uncharacterized protein BDR25DRAFT_59598 [Lindgomyces ingoldianus]|uniref:Uncharacterized protein n=1 Tax=Lindgomyces ingoldianus TaxID=673940 RepID=A0ACB6QNV5_9PLEO|nr:uncharacterized protein BDR25DRAFT_59598 [Lindgomyces ingoldianus]KAF2467782.1 hypothetical protein BDR25DRAFT_59598 [Lindgomyces ingoldianus]